MIVRIEYYQATNRQCVFLGASGFSHKLIAAQTGLSLGQVKYRLKKTHTKVRDYRNGKGPVAQFVLSEVEKQKVIRLNINQRLHLAGKGQ